jgi:hypothetical protein
MNIIRLTKVSYNEEIYFTNYGYGFFGLWGGEGNSEERKSKPKH